MLVVHMENSIMRKKKTSFVTMDYLDPNIFESCDFLLHTQEILFIS